MKFTIRKSCRAIFGTQTFGSQTPPPPSNTSLPPPPPPCHPSAPVPQLCQPVAVRAGDSRQPRGAFRRPCLIAPAGRSKKKRRALGFRTSQQLLDSMSDIVKTLHSTDPGTSFKYYPANAPPETGGALGPVEQPAAKDNVVAVPYMVPFWAIMRLQPKRGETQGKRVVHPEYLLLRDAVQLSIRYFPKGTDLWTFARKTGLGTPQVPPPPPDLPLCRLMGWLRRWWCWGGGEAHDRSG